LTLFTSIRKYWRIYWIHFLILFATFGVLAWVDWATQIRFYHNHRFLLTIGILLFLVPLSSAAILQRIVTSKELKSEYYDSLTRLPSRNYLFQKLYEFIDTNSDFRFALLFLDLDRFKTVNDSLGHTAGDQLLAMVAERLNSCIADGGLVARLGGDEFAILLTTYAQVEEVESKANQILHELSEPFIIDGKELFCTVSIGISVYPTNGHSAEMLIQHAESAMYLAKDQGRNQFQFYTPQLRESAAERMELENSLRRAMGKNEFYLLYQPKVDIKTNQIIGMEALLRWNHGKKGLISPSKFIPVAEETGLIVPIGDWVLRHACAQNKAWQDAGFKPLCVAVNLSARQFQRQNLPSVVRKILDETGLEPQWLELEVTESILMQNIDKTVATLHELKAMGVRISIDDFGTGYSSLNYLKRFPIDTLKIDQSFVRDIANDPDDAAIVTAVISLAHTMKLKVIAEGVETIDQLEFLRHKNCDKMQGYFYSKPLVVDAFTDLLRRESGVYEAFMT
jgi:diguanylate cyclase (GGDEF)-like protein